MAMFKLFTKQRGMIVLSILISLAVVKFGSPQVFLADTPTVKPEFIASVKNLPGVVAQMPGRLVALLPKFGQNQSPLRQDSVGQAGIALNKIEQVTPPPDAPFRSIAKGVSAAETSDGKKYLKIEAGTKYTTKTETINGKEYQVIEIVQ
jgi:hypothetical protein